MSRIWGIADFGSTHHFYANLKKFSFEQEEVAFIGHIISGKGVATDPES